MKFARILRATASALLLAMPMQLVAQASKAEEVTISHYFTGDLGLKGMQAFFEGFEKETGIAVKDSGIGHEDYKTGILVRAAANRLPDVFSYGAGARPQFVVDAGNVAPVDDIWDSAQLGDVVSKSIADSATIYNGKRYFIPVGYHYAGIFFNPKAMKTAGISEMPKTWDGLLAACKTLREHNIAPISLGSKSRWPAQFWFDYLLLGTAGPDYRNSLMRGDASFTDSQVKRAMGMWKGLVDADCFAPNSNAKEWTDAADEVARGEAAMTLMGTWITGYWNNNKLQPVQDYDFFPFPKLDDAVPVSVVGPVDGFLVAANSQNPQGARKLLAFMVSNVPLQANWAKVQGALSPNTKVDPSIYDPVMKKALDTVSTAQNFAFNYDLATPPPVAEVGLDMFAEFMNDSSDVDALLERTQEGAKAAFAK